MPFIRGTLAATATAVGADPDTVVAIPAPRRPGEVHRSCLDVRRALAQERSLRVGLKNDLDQVDAFDFAVDESCVQYRECTALEPFRAQGKPVLHVEYERSTASSAR